MWDCGARHGEPIFVKTCSFFLVGLALHLDQGCCCSASCAGPRRVTKAWVNRLGIERQRWISFLWKRCWFKQVTRQITEGITSSRLFKHGSLHKAVLTKEGWNEWLWLGYMDEKASWELQTDDWWQETWKCCIFNPVVPFPRSAPSALGFILKDVSNVHATQ